MSVDDQPDHLGKVRFVEVVKKFPCIYDFNNQDHNRREMVERAWTTIADETNESIPHCKDKWKNLRTAFARSIRKNSLGLRPNKHMKDYYLKNAMEFLVPFIQSKPSKDPFQSPEETQSGIFEEKQRSNNTGDIVGNFGTQENLSLNNHKKRTHDSSLCEDDDVNISAGTPNEIFKKRNHKRTVNETQQFFIDYVNYKKTLMPHRSDPDLDFLKSLLPDIAKMNDFQKRQFKKRTLDVIDSILCDTPKNMPAQSHVPSRSSAISYCTNTISPSYCKK